jgi:hypothetical protein
MNDVMMVIKRFGCMVIQQEMQLFCRMIIGIPKADEQVCLDKLSEMHTVALAKQ